MNDGFHWKSTPRAPQELFLRFPELDPIVVQLLHNRQIDSQEGVDYFLTSDYGQDQHDPFLFRDMRKSVDRVKDAIVAGEKIVIHGDYDADGVCGASALYLTLKTVGARVEVYLPHRDTEGYGLNMNTVQSLHDVGTNLIITVDCGISNKPEVEKAAALGMDVIVTDHHSEPPELPTAAYAIMNPKISGETYPFKYLAGVGVGFKFCQAMAREYRLGDAFEKWLLDVVAISTITDFVELTGENRIFVKYGLVVLRKNRRPGLRALFTAMGVDPATADVETIAFKIGPHINAAGRVKHANMAFEMLVEEDEQKALVCATDLCTTNRERQKLSEKMSTQAMLQAEAQKNEFVIVVQATDWPVGLVGLVAGKVASAYHRPTFVLTTMNHEPVGSGRSIEQFDLVAALQSMPELFSKYGGHPMACGFSLVNEEAIAVFTQRMRERSREQLDGQDLRKSLRIEAELQLADTDWKLIETLQQFAPFGEGNPEPIFMSARVIVEEVSTVGKTGAHLRLTVSQAGVKRKCIAFGFGALQETLAVGDVIDIAYHSGVNEWNGNREIQLMIKDIHTI